MIELLSPIPALVEEAEEARVAVRRLPSFVFWVDPAPCSGQGNVLQDNLRRV